MGRGVGKLLHLAVPTLGQAAQMYVARPKLRSEAYKAGVTRQFDRYLSDWLNLPLNEITKTMVVQRHFEMRSTPVNANRVLRMFRSVWNHIRRTVELSECPTKAIEWFEEKPDLRIIDNLFEWRAAVEALDSPIHETFYKMALFTGLRKTELLELEWSNVHDDHIHIPMTKNGRSFDLPITEDHHQILEQIKGLNRSWVFPSSKSSAGHVTNPTRLIWSIHAHRRTFATVAVEAGVLEEIVGRLLNHTPMSVTGQRYARPRLDALRPSMEWICREIKARTKVNCESTP